MRCNFCKGTGLLNYYEFIDTKSDNPEEWFKKMPHEDACCYCEGTGHLSIKKRFWLTMMIAWPELFWRHVDKMKGEEDARNKI